MKIRQLEIVNNAAGRLRRAFSHRAETRAGLYSGAAIVHPALVERGECKRARASPTQGQERLFLGFVRLMAARLFRRERSGIFS